MLARLKMKKINDLRRAIFMGHTDEALKLMEHSEVTDNINDLLLGDTCLHVACQGGLVDVARALIERGADFEKLNNSGETPLHNAATKGKLQCVELLVRHGADTTRVNRHGKTALEQARWRHRKDVVKYLEGLEQRGHGMQGGVHISSGYQAPSHLGATAFSAPPSQGYPPPTSNYGAPGGYPAPSQSYPACGAAYGPPYPTHGAGCAYPIPPVTPQGYPSPGPKHVKPGIPQTGPGDYADPQGMLTTMMLSL